MSALAPTLQGFFTERLHRPAPGQPAHRRLLPRHLPAAARLRPTPHRQGAVQARTSTTSTPSLIGAFLDHLEHERHNSVRTRNTRLAAIHSLFAYAALRHPEHAALIQRVLAIPAKRFDRQLVSFLTDDEVDALLAAPDRDTWVGRRDHALLLVAVQTGLRVSRAHLAHLRRRRARHRRPPPLPRQGPQGADHTAHHPGVRRAARLARPSAAGRPTDAAVPHPPRRPAQPRRRRRTSSPSTRAPPPSAARH